MGERLTVKPDSGLGLQGCETFKNDCDENCFDCHIIEEAIEKLQKYEDDEEAGVLIKLPVKVGQTVWVIEDVYEGKKRTGSKVVAFTVDRFVIGENMTPVVMVCNENNNWIDLEDNEWGKTVFLTREEAEKALETANES